jgi:hypothetical protein
MLLRVEVIVVMFDRSIAFLANNSDILLIVAVRSFVITMKSRLENFIQNYNEVAINVYLSQEGERKISRKPFINMVKEPRRVRELVMRGEDISMRTKLVCVLVCSKERLKLVCVRGMDKAYIYV